MRQASDSFLRALLVSDQRRHSASADHPLNRSFTGRRAEKPRPQKACRTVSWKNHSHMPPEVVGAQRSHSAQRTQLGRGWSGTEPRGGWTRGPGRERCPVPLAPLLLFAPVPRARLRVLPWRSVSSCHVHGDKVTTRTKSSSQPLVTLSLSCPDLTLVFILKIHAFWFTVQCIFTNTEVLNTPPRSRYTHYPQSSLMPLCSHLCPTAGPGCP